MHSRPGIALLALLGGAACAPPLPVTWPAQRWQPVPEPTPRVERHCEWVDARDPSRLAWLTTWSQRVALVSAECTCAGACTGPVLELDLDGGPSGAIASIACQPADEPSSHAIALDRHEVVRFKVVDVPRPQPDDYRVCFDYRVERARFN